MGKRSEPGFAVRVCSVAVLLAVTVSAHAESPRNAAARGRSSTTVSFTSPGQFALEQFLGPLGLRLQSLATSKHDFPRRPRMSRSQAPARQVTFLGGDRITAEIVRWEGDSVELRIKGGQTATVPRGAIASVSPAEGEADVLHESFEESSASDAEVERQSNAEQQSNVDQQSAMWSVIAADRRDSTHAASGRRSLRCGVNADPVELRFAPGLATSRVQFWFRVDGPDKDEDEGNIDDRDRGDSTSLKVEFDFSAEPTAARWTMNASRDRATMTVDGPARELANTQIVSLRRGWHCLTALMRENHSICAIDDTLLVSLNRSPGSLAKLRISATTPAWCDDLIVSRILPLRMDHDLRPSTQDDCVALWDGEEWFGRVKQVTSTRVVLASPVGDRSVAWSRVKRIALCQLDQPIAGRASPRGLWSGIQFQATVDRPHQAADRLHGTITLANRDLLILAHPWLGDVAISWNEIERIEPQFFGRTLTVDARRRHLGDSIRDDFQRQVPDGTEWTVEFDVAEAIPAQAEIWLSLYVVDLEPSGPGTPIGSPYLKELRAGKLVTTVSVNRQPAGDLNRWVRFRAAIGRPDPLRCRLPAGSIKLGRNTVTLLQTPLKESGVGIDNCELSNLRIEIVEP